jgi:serine carboxypeptidase-like clade 2
LFIAGESYGGIYAPYLTWEIYQWNVMADQTGAQKYNLGGLMVGNGATDWEFDVSPSFPEAAHGFNIIPRKLLKNFTDAGCKVYFNDFKSRDGPPACNQMWDQIGAYAAHLNWYDLMRHHTFDPNSNDTLMSDSPDRYRTIERGGKNVTYKRGYTFSEMFSWHRSHPGVILGKQFREVVKAGDISDYMNNETLRKSLHVDSNPNAWEQCNGYINENYREQNEASLWIYRVLKYQTDIKMLFFSGDTDGAIPTVGSRKWVQKLGWKVEEEWRPWYDSE